MSWVAELFELMRRGNVLAARWEEINLEMNLWRVPNTKNGDPLNVPLVPEAVAILQERKPQPQGFIFAGESATGHISPPKELWRKLLERAELADFTIHDLRRSLGSWQAIGGASLYSEDLQDGQVFEGRLTVKNPFAGQT